SNNSEIKDQAVIQAFEERESLEDLFEKPFQQLEQEEGLRFESELEARFHAGDAVGELYDIQRKGTRFLFLSRSTYLINPQLPPSLNSLGFFLGMLEYTDRLGEPNAGGMRTTREVRVAHGNYKVLKASAFAYVLKHSDPNGAGEEALNLKGLEYNEFNANVIKHLRQNDTLAVKEYSIIYSLEK
ncbi:MAG TPA: hypothetical protein VKZ78_03105, partial [Sphingobacteriaceae bacterium]|nr:hypothetical protein [Sphingobacteriaceae bacterium]